MLRFIEFTLYRGGGETPMQKRKQKQKEQFCGEGQDRQERLLLLHATKAQQIRISQV